MRGPLAMMARPKAEQGGWTPNDIADTVAWWDASDAESFIYSAGTTVQRWSDLSGNGHHLLNDGTGLSARATQPERDATVNGLPAVRFDGSMNIARGPDVVDLNWPATAWAIVQMVNLGGVLIGHYRISLRGQTKWALDSSAGLNSTVDGDTTGPHCLIGIITSADDAAIVVDGVTTNGDAVGDEAWNQEELLAFMLGTNSVGGSYQNPVFNPDGTEPANGLVCEAGITASALTPGDQSALRTYAQGKWGTP